jgi:hypothetical protein
MLAAEMRKGEGKNSLWRQHRSYALLFVLSLFMLGSVTSCTDKTGLPEDNNCGVKATVKDLTGLDGCGYVLELENGERLEPSLDSASATPSIKGVTLQDGMKVTVAYQELKDRGSICMAGKIVEVTCLTQVGQASGE